MIRVKRNEKESVDRMLSRFNKLVQSSRVILEVKNKRYFKKDQTRRVSRKAAVMREFHRDRRNKMQYY